MFEFLLVFGYGRLLFPAIHFSMSCCTPCVWLTRCSTQRKCPKAAHSNQQSTPESRKWNPSRYSCAFSPSSSPSPIELILRKNNSEYAVSRGTTISVIRYHSLRHNMTLFNIAYIFFCYLLILI